MLVARLKPGPLTRLGCCKGDWRREHGLERPRPSPLAKNGAPASAVILPDFVKNGAPVLVPGLGLCAPFVCVGLGQANVLQDAVDVIANDVVDGGGMIVEGWGDRKDGSAGFGDSGHIADVNEVEWGFAGAEDERPAFFEANVGGAVDQVFGEAVSDGG